MSFWSDASGVVKGVIIFGVVGLVYLLVAYIGGLPPYGSDEPVQQQRGINAAAAE